MKAMILGSGPSKDFSKLQNFSGLHIVCDRQYHNCIEKGIKIDYLVTLEDENFPHYFSPPHQNPKPIVITSLRTTDVTKNVLGDQEFLIKIFNDELLNVCYNVGMVAWLYAWMKLGCKEIHLNGFDHLYPVEGYDLLHHLWRDMFWEIYEDHCPKDVTTVFEKPEQAKIQRSKDSISLDRIDSKYPGFKDKKDYIRYRRDRNELFVRKLKKWDS